MRGPAGRLHAQGALRGRIEDAKKAVLAVSDDDPVKVLSGSAAMRPWSVGIDGADAIFIHLPTTHDADEVTVHVWPGQSMLLPADSLPGLDVAVEAVMSTSDYAHRAHAGGTAHWGAVRPGFVAGSVSLDGPVRAFPQHGAGLQQTRTIVIALGTCGGCGSGSQPTSTPPAPRPDRSRHGMSSSQPACSPAPPTTG